VAAQNRVEREEHSEDEKVKFVVDESRRRHLMMVHLRAALLEQELEPEYATVRLCDAEAVEASKVLEDSRKESPAASDFVAVGGIL
jgi:Ser-tRNA(Ala) deacylase AlaX